jgi:hypothetical protein
MRRNWLSLPVVEKISQSDAGKPGKVYIWNEGGCLRLVI